MSEQKKKQNTEMDNIENFLNFNDLSKRNELLLDQSLHNY